MNKKKRLDWILRGNFGAAGKLKDVLAVMGDLEYERIDSSSGSHFVFCREGEEEQKTIPVKGGKRVKRPYLKQIQKNAKRIFGGADHG